MYSFLDKIGESYSKSVKKNLQIKENPKRIEKIENFQPNAPSVRRLEDELFLSEFIIN